MAPGPPCCILKFIANDDQYYPKNRGGNAGASLQQLDSATVTQTLNDLKN